MRVTIVGTGYVGLVSGVCLAELGHDVVCVDVDQQKVDLINAEKAPIYEQGLDELMARNVGRRLVATTDLAVAFRDSELILICVGTPFDGRKIDLQYVLSAARSIGALIRDSDRYCVVAVKSTVVPGTTQGPVREILEATSGKRAGKDFGLGMNPEFLSEGVAVRDFMAPDRIVIGGVDERSRDTLSRLYQKFDDTPVLRTNVTTAEMIKYASNAFLASMISFANEIAGYCEAIDGIDVADVFQGVHRMKHLVYRNDEGNRQFVSATSFLWPGCGFGGSCFPKDVKALVAQAEANDVPANLLTAVLEVNAQQPERMIDHLLAHYPDLHGRAITVLGLAFKPDTDDVRESPALRIVSSLVARGAKVICHDPMAIENATRALIDYGIDLQTVVFEHDLAKAIADCDAILLTTRWSQYADLPELLKERQSPPLLVDGRRFIPRSEYSRYAGIGIKPDSSAASASEVLSKRSTKIA